ncbi:GCN5-related N-acetyltransferase [Paenibacillus vortex V453]|uniref:GCN5 family acetyltransferase n=2 Tax=Paenibacillus TaxID=44249 RepID=A0A163MFR9_9BACL|nr:MULTISPECIES: GNAT family protein [Paenibacillus]ANA83357.1 GCN5 family acetyltransferase [Paenibacillus glucanolyticus]AVV60129.1 N-acetyltransferase [Paenibacillus glucanolyticus]AWP30762.1 GNAT family N-acetyltransferase [Paenibacillus sp. Cedars]EFU38170.1 GCN5-related N-acetyltransferase [Paenibacillus vortex V453]ETT38970.1 GCN5-like N-acetyltransferase [Paenibacillus sp. FSL R5-808]
MEIEQIYGNLPVLETERLRLRRVSMQDANEMYVYASDDEVTKHVTWETHRSVNDSKRFIQFILAQYAKHDIAPWGIELKESGRMVGTVDFVWWKPGHQSAEIGYVLARDCWGQGLMTEAATALLKLGFGQMELVRIQARCITENIGSQRVMEKIGMSYEGTLRKGIKIKGQHWDLKLFSILKEDYESAN